MPRIEMQTIFDAAVTPEELRRWFAAETPEQVARLRDLCPDSALADLAHLLAARGDREAAFAVVDRIRDPNAWFNTGQLLTGDLVID